MARGTRLSVRIAIIISALMTLVLGSVITIIGLRLRKDVGSVIEENFINMANSRAAEVNRLLQGYVDELSMLATLDGLAKGTLEEARELVAPITASGNVPGVVSVSVVDESGMLKLPDGSFVNISNQEYFQAIFNEFNDVHISDIMVPPGYDKPAIIISKAVKRSVADKYALILQASVENLSEITSEMKIGRVGYGWIVDHRSTVIAHPQKDLVMSCTFSELQGDTPHDKSLRALASKMAENYRGDSEYIGEDGEELTSFFATIPNTPNWKIGINMSTHDIYGSITRLLLVLAIIFVAALALSIVVALFIARSIAKPVQLAAHEFRILASGEADLTKNLMVTSRDEIGNLARDFNLFIEKLREIVGNLKETQNQLGKIGDDLRGGVQNTASAVDQIRTRADYMRAQTRIQNECVAASSSAVEEIAKTIENLDALIVNQSASIAEASASIEEMVGNIGSVSTSVGRIAERFQSISEASEEGNAMQSETSERVAEIASQSATLLEANEVIAGIASQTNLLAMNAAIEAAHAGESGKGFSVVADEIRRLAETSTEQSQSIGVGLKKVQEAISKVVETSQNTERSFANLANLIRETGLLTQEVGAAMTEQREGSTQILTALKAMNDISAQVRSGSAEMREGNAAILEEISRLRTSAQEIGRGSDEVVHGVVDVAENTENIASVTSQTETLLQRMEKAIGRFKT